MNNPEENGFGGGSQRFDVVGVGYSAIDFLGIIPHYPKENLKLELKEFKIQGGGPAATAVVTTSRLGLKSSYLGIVGDDIFSGKVLEELSDEGVDTSSVLVKKGGKSQFAFIMVDELTGARTILWSRGNLPYIEEERVNEELISSARVLLIDTLEPRAALRAAQIARDSGIPVVIDAGTLREGVEKLLPLCDYIVASEVFASQIAGSGSLDGALDILFAYGPKAAVVTLGERGCSALDVNGRFSAEGFVVETVDTTGAGDVFHGAFLFSVLQDWDIYRKCVFSNAVAALKCRKLGGRSGIPSLEETLAFLEREKPGIEFKVSV